MIVVGIKPDTFIKDSGNKGKSYIEYVAAAFGHDFIEVNDIDEIPKDKPIILFSDHGENVITDFKFPDDAYLVFGPDWEDIDITGYTSVKIPVELHSFRSIYASQAAAIVLWEQYKANL